MTEDTYYFSDNIQIPSDDFLLDEAGNEIGVKCPECRGPILFNSKTHYCPRDTIENYFNCEACGRLLDKRRAFHSCVGEKLTINDVLDIASELKGSDKYGSKLF